MMSKFDDRWPEVAAQLDAVHNLRKNIPMTTKSKASGEELAVINGWAVIRNPRDLKRYRKTAYDSYLSDPPGFPCLVKSQISADENGFEVYLSAENLEQMLESLRALDEKRNNE